MSDHARRLLADVLRLRVEERAEVAAELLRSLDRDEPRVSQSDVDRLWADEIVRRAQRAVRGESEGQDADAVLASIEAKLTR
jgi:Putative addiction module component